MFENPSKALMIALRDFVFRHDIFVEGRDIDDGLIFVRRPKGRSKKLGPRRHFRVSLSRNRRRVHFYTVTCGSNDTERYQVSIDLPEKALLRPAEAAIEYERCRRDGNRASMPPFGIFTSRARATLMQAASGSTCLRRACRHTLDPRRPATAIIRRSVRGVPSAGASSRRRHIRR